MKLSIAGRLDGATEAEERWVKQESLSLAKGLQKRADGPSSSEQELLETARFFGVAAVTAEERARYRLLGLWAEDPSVVAA